jgi:putative hydrolase of the HAD superfamily
MRTPRALFFDLDATLLAGGRLPDAVAKTCEQLAFAYPGLNRDDLSRANWEASEAYWPKVEMQWTLGKLGGQDISLEVWRRTLAACCLHDEAVVRVASDTFTAHVRLGHCLFDDAGRALDALRRRFLLGIITNGAQDSQREKLQCTDLEAVFDAIVISGEVGVAKPDSLIFRMALDMLGVAPAEAWHIGDTLATDIAGARGAAVWLNRTGRERGEHEPEPDLEVRSLLDLGELLGSLGDSG